MIPLGIQGLSLSAFLTGGFPLSSRLAANAYGHGASFGSENDTTSSRTDRIFACDFLLGSSNYSDLQVMFDAWTFGSYGPQDTGGYTIKFASIQIGSTYIPITFDGGTLSKILPAGATDVGCDPILPSAFSLANFAIGLTGKIWVHLSLHNPGVSSYPASTNNITSAKYKLDPTTVTYTGGPKGGGAFSITGGTNYSGTGSAYMPILIGTPIGSGAKRVIGVGDSITQGTGDGWNTYGFGINRVLSTTNTGGVAAPIAVLNMGLPGCTLKSWILQGVNDLGQASASGAVIPYVAKRMKYGNIIVEQFGTNGTFTTGGGVYGYNRVLWQMLRNLNPTAKLGRSSLFPRTPSGAGGSSDSWATVAGQNPSQAPGGDTNLFENYNKAQVGVAGGVDFYVQYNTCRANTDPANADYYRWAVNGTANWPTTDGLHPAGVLHDLMYRTELRPIIDNLSI
jgi:hypothetical protein